MQHDFERLQAYYRQVEAHGGWAGSYSKTTDPGLFVPSDLGHILGGLSTLAVEGIIDLSRPSLDAGLGDGRILALLSYLGSPSVGVEIDAELCSLARQHLKQLRKQGIINGVPTTVIRGDFAELDTYAQAGIDFGGFGTVYNYVNNPDEIAGLMAHCSAPGTCFLLHEATSEPEQFDGLRFHKSLEFFDFELSGYVYLHVYIKQ